MRSTARAPGTLRVLAPARGAVARRVHERATPSFELSISRQGLGVELASPYEVEAWRVSHLRADLPGLRFPLDVTGGLARFRSHRSVLNLLRLEADVAALELALAPQAGGCLGRGPHRVRLRSHDDHVSVSVSLEREAAWDDQSSPVLVFDVFPLVEGGHLSLGVSRARGHALAQPARAVALSLMHAWTSQYTERIGGSFAFVGLGREICTDLFVAAGMRAPRVPVAGLAFECSAHRLGVTIDTLNIDVAPTERALGVGEHLRLMLATDDALAIGDLDGARAACLEALTRAPKHAEASATLASIDATHMHRWEAALLSLYDAGETHALGTLAAELHVRRGEIDKAARAAGISANTESSPELAARALALAATLSPDSLMSPMWLDEMVSLAPEWARGRILRLKDRLRRGDLQGAQADAQMAEASVRGARRSFDMLCALGRIFAAAGYPKEAGAYFERALTFAPDDARALGELGESLLARGLRKRGLQLVRDAIDRGERALVDMAQSRITLARAIAASTGDLPTAVSVLREIPDASAHAPAARSTEARWLSSLGELAAASMAWSRYAHLVQQSSDLSHVDSLREALQFELNVRCDTAAAKHLARVGLLLQPGDGEFMAAFGMTPLAAIAPHADAAPTPAAQDAVTHAPTTDAGVTADARQLEAHPSPPADAASSAPTFAEMDEGEATQRVEDLSVDLRRNPNDTGVVAELVHHLTRLGRSMDLLALLSARLEEASPEQRRSYLPDTIRVYRELAAHARQGEGGFEAELYESAAQMLSDELLQ